MGSSNAGWLTVAACAALLGVGAGAATPARAASVKEVFEKFQLLGVFAGDCSKEVSAANPYFVARVLDDGHMQRDRMISATTRDQVLIIDQAREITSDEILTSGQRDDRQTQETLWRMEGNRVHAMESSLGGKKVISGGKWVTDGRDVGWFYKCSATPTAPVAAAQPPSAATAAPPAASASAGCRTDNFTFSAVLGRSATANSVSTAGAACVHTVAPIHPDQVQFTSAEIVEQPSNGTFEQTGAFAFKYQPKPGFKGTDEYAIKVCGHNSERAGCATVTYRVTVQ